MSDYFVFRDHECIVRACVDIIDRPSCFEKLIGLGLDPLVYRLRWISPDRADVWEYWWGTTVGSIIRVPYKYPCTPYNSKKALPRGFASSPTPYRDNSML